MELFKDAFKFNTTYLLDKNNGSVSTKYLSHKNPKKPPRIRSTISGTMVKALAMWCKGNIEEILDDSTIITICKSDNIIDKMYCTKVTKDPDINSIFYFVIENGVERVPESFAFSHWSLYAPLLCKLYREDMEMREALDKLKADFIGNGSEYFSLEREIFIYCDLMYFSKEEYPNNAVPAKFPIDKKPAKKSVKEKESKKVAFESEDYNLPWDRELTEDEKQLIPNMGLGVEVIMPDYVYETAKFIKGEYDSLIPVKNILWYGGAGTGKSFSTKILAQLLQVPHYAFDFSNGADEVTITAGADVSEGTVTYNESRIATACRNGGVVEFREFYNAKPNVISFLNGFLQEGELRLANGKVIKRHPNCIVVATSNINYAGCQQIDYSTDDRFFPQYEIEPLPENKLIELVENGSGNHDVALLKKLVKFFKDINVHLNKIEYDEGIASVRKLIAWAKLCKPVYGKSVIEAAEITILSGISKDKKKRQEIIDQYLSHVFSV